jgi:hypothetical protein
LGIWSRRPNGGQGVFGQTAISSVIGKGNRREIVIEAGKSHKFTVPEEELPR